MVEYGSKFTGTKTLVTNYQQQTKPSIIQGTTSDYYQGYHYKYQVSGIETIGDWHTKAYNAALQALSEKAPGSYLSYAKFDDGTKTAEFEFLTPYVTTSQAMAIPGHSTVAYAYQSERTQGYEPPAEGMPFAVPLVALLVFALPYIEVIVVAIAAVIIAWIAMQIFNMIINTVHEFTELISGEHGIVPQIFTMVVLGALAIGGVYIAIKLVPAVARSFGSDKPKHRRPREDEDEEDVDWL